MKFITKHAAWITAAILGILAIVFTSLFFVKNNELNSLENATAFLYGNKKVRIIAFTGDDDISTPEDERTKILDDIYVTSKTERTLQNLMENKTSTFKLGDNTDYGKPVIGIKNETTNQFVDTSWANNTWWKLLSPTYYSDAGTSMYNPANFETWTSGSNFDGSRYKGTDTLTGAVGLHLIQDQIFVFEFKTGFAY